MTAPRHFARPIHWMMTLLENGTAIGDVLFATNGAQDWVTLGGRTFAPGETIDNFEFAQGMCVANRHFHRYEHVELALTGARRSYTFDLQRMVGWRWYGMRPCLRITDRISGRERFFVCVPQGMFESQWAELSPVAQAPRWLAVWGQLQMIGYLLQDAMVVAILYWLPLYLTGNKLVAVVDALAKWLGLSS